MSPGGEGQSDQQPPAEASTWSPTSSPPPGHQGGLAAHAVGPPHTSWPGVGPENSHFHPASRCWSPDHTWRPGMKGEERGGRGQATALGCVSGGEFAMGRVWAGHSSPASCPHPLCKPVPLSGGWTPQPASSRQDVVEAAVSPESQSQGTVTSHCSHPGEGAATGKPTGQ